MTVPLWLLIPGVPLALIGAVVVAFAAAMLADEIRLARQRRNRPASARPTLTVLTDPDHNPDLDDESLGGLVVDHRLNGRTRR